MLVLKRIISGMGILNIYDYLKSTGKYSEPRWLSSKLSGGDPAKVINEMASERAQRLCLKTIDLFLSILGEPQEILPLLALQGRVYLGGGIPPKLIWRIEEDTFMKAFTAKGRFKELMNKIPVSVILNNNAGLLGAAITGFKG
jgi:glucokinase